MLLELLIGVGIWFMIFLAGSIAGGVTSLKLKDEQWGMMITQLCFILLSILIIVIVFDGQFGEFGFTLNLYYSLLGTFIAFVIAFPLAFLSARASHDYEPPFAPKKCE